MEISSIFYQKLRVLLFFCFVLATGDAARAENSLVAKALESSEKGRAAIAPYLSQKQSLLYLSDAAYIGNFPFKQYRKVKVKSQGTFFIDDIDDTIKNCLRSKRPWEIQNKRIIEKYVKRGSLALDIGAHIGTHTVTMSQMVGNLGLVIAFEPGRAIHRELCYNLAVNSCRNVIPVRCAIGKEESVINVVTSHPNNQGGCYVVESDEGENLAALLPLDALKLDNISFIKIDVENLEADVLDGARETILRNRPVMLIEVQGNGERPAQLEEDTEEMARISIEKIRGLGYKLLNVSNHDYLAFPL